MTGPGRDVFTASNGYEFQTHKAGGVQVFFPGREESYGIDLDDKAVWREFFQHERDKELGRWRWPERPEYVVYPNAADSNFVRVMWERNGWSIQYARDDLPMIASLFMDAARAYFEAHPEPKPGEEPKPWENAKDGEIWEMQPHAEYADYTVQYLVNDGRFFQLPLRTPSDNDWKPANFPSEFVDGRRIWPEGDQ